MKKLSFFVLIACLTGLKSLSAQGNDVFFSSSSNNREYYRYEEFKYLTNNDFSRDLPGNPGGHGGDGDVPAPLGSGLLLLTGMGVGYAIMKKHRD